MSSNNALRGAHIDAQPNALCEPISPAVLVLLLALSLRRSEEHELTELANGLDATSALDAFETRFPTSAQHNNE